MERTFRSKQWVSWAGPELPGAYKGPSGRYVGVTVAPGTDALGGVQKDWAVRPVNDEGGDVLYLAKDGAVKRLECVPAFLDDLQPLLDLQEIPYERRRHIPEGTVLKP